MSANSVGTAFGLCPPYAFSNMGLVDLPLPGEANQETGAKRCGRQRLRSPVARPPHNAGDVCDPATVRTNRLSTDFRNFGAGKNKSVHTARGGPSQSIGGHGFS